jgi:hypothetical protein
MAGGSGFRIVWIHDDKLRHAMRAAKLDRPTVAIAVEFNWILIVKLWLRVPHSLRRLQGVRGFHLRLNPHERPET